MAWPEKFLQNSLNISQKIPRTCKCDTICLPHNMSVDLQSRLDINKVDELDPHLWLALLPDWLRGERRTAKNDYIERNLKC